MVLLRAPLGRRGSYAPTVLNVAQNVGWSTFELIIIAAAAAALSEHLFGWKGTWLWTILFGILSWGLGMLGPIGFVRRYLRKFASWALLFSMAYLTYWAVTKSHLHAFWAQPGKGGFPTFGQAIDLVIGSVVSWTPLAADYTRFSRTRRGAALGAGFGYFVPTIWCIGLGILDRARPRRRRRAVAARRRRRRRRRRLPRAARDHDRREREGVRRHLLHGGVDPEPRAADVAEAADHDRRRRRRRRSRSC